MGVAYPEPPNGGWGWVVTFCCFVNAVLLSSCFISFTILFPEIVSVFHTTNATVAFIGSLQIGFTMFFNVVSGFLVYQFGCRPVSIVGFLISGCGISSSYFCTTILQLYFTYGLITGVGQSMSMTACIVIVQQYFTTKRTLATGLTVCGLSIGGLVVAPYITTLLNMYTLKGTFLIHGAVLLNGMVLSTSFRPISSAAVKKVTTSDDNRHGKLHRLCHAIFDIKLFQECEFMLYCCGSFCMNYCTMTFHQHIVNCLVKRGFLLDEASLMILLIGASSLVSRIFSSFIFNMECVNRLLVIAVATFLSGVMVAVSVFSPDLITMSMVACGYGLCSGAVLTVQFPILVDLLGIKRLAHANGIYSVFLGTSIFIASPVTGLLVDHYGDYMLAFIINSCICIAGGFLILYAFIRSWRKNKAIKIDKEKAINAGESEPMSSSV